MSTARSGRQVVLAAVDVRAEGHAVVGQLAQVGQRHHLEAAGIGQDRPGPVHEPVQPAQPLDPLRARPQHQVIGVAEHDLGARSPHRVGRHRLDRRRGADRHEGRRLDGAVGGVQPAAPRRAVGGERLEAEAGHAGALQQAGVAVGVEAVALGDGVGIGRLHPLEPGEGADQHEQGRARQVEVGQQQVGAAEPVAGRDEDVGLALERMEPAVGVDGALQQAQAGGADGDDAPARRPRGVDPLGRRGADLAPFAMHAVVLDPLGLDRQEGAGADVEGQEHAADAGVLQRPEQAFGEVEPGGRRGDRARPLGVDGLVVGAVGVLRALGPRDVGRQRHLAGLFQGVEQRRVGQPEVEQHLALGPLLGHRRRQAVAEVDPVVRPQPLGRPGEGEPAPVAGPPVQGHLDLGLAAPAAQPRRDHPCVVEHHQVARPQQVGQVADAVVAKLRADGQQPRRIARLGRPVGDPLARQLEVEVGGLHGIRFGVVGVFGGIRHLSLVEFRCVLLGSARAGKAESAEPRRATRGGKLRKVYLWASSVIFGRRSGFRGLLSDGAKFWNFIREINDKRPATDEANALRRRV